MSKTNINDISYKIEELVEKLNNCIRNWYFDYYPNKFKLGDFKECCTKDEIKLITDCYNIYIKQHSSNYIDDILKDDILRAIIELYYISQILEYYVMSSSDRTDEDDASTIKPSTDELYIVDCKEKYKGYKEVYVDNMNNHYKLTKEYKEPLPLINVNGTMMRLALELKPLRDLSKDYYVFLDKKNDDFMYKAERINHILEYRKLEQPFFSCLYYFHTYRSKNIMDNIILSNDQWASKIRRKINNMDINTASNLIRTGGKSKHNKKSQRKTRKYHRNK